jgi:hypothetical protein
MPRPKEGVGYRETVKTLETPRTAFIPMKPIRMISMTPMVLSRFLRCRSLPTADDQRLEADQDCRCDGRHRTGMFPCMGWIRGLLL